MTRTQALRMAKARRSGHLLAIWKKRDEAAERLWDEKYSFGASPIGSSIKIKIPESLTVHR